MIVWLIVSIIGLLRIVIEDIKHRSVYLVWFIIALIGVLGFAMSSDYVSLSITNIISNLIICFFVILLTGILYFLKYKFNSAEILRKSIGNRRSFYASNNYYMFFSHQFPFILHRINNFRVAGIQHLYDFYK